MTAEKMPGDISNDTATNRDGLPSTAIIGAPSGRIMPVEPEPIFLHSSFRTGSTWLWAKIRAAPTAIAYYEIFHEALAQLTYAEVKGIDFKSWNSRHPATSPYLVEFLPLLQEEGGVAGYDRAMAFERFVPSGGPDGPLSTSDQAYVDRLVAAARQRGRIPVLTCTRSLGRARALRRAVGGRAILLHRNLFHQWASYCSLADSADVYFIETIRMTMAASAHDPFLHDLATYFDVRNPSLPREDLFQVFVLMHLYLQGFAFDAADLVVDVTGIATDPHARRRVERHLSEMIQYPLDLSDVRQVCEQPDMGFAWSKTVRDTIEQFAKLIPEAGRSAESVGFVEHTKDLALAEWERFEFFNRKTRSVLTGRIDHLETKLAAQVALGGDLRAENAKLDTALSDAVRAAASERETLAQQVASAEVELQELRAQVASLSTERDRLSATAATATARDDLRDRASEEGSFVGSIRKRWSRKVRRGAP